MMPFYFINCINVKITTYSCANSMSLSRFVDFLLSFYPNDLKFCAHSLYYYSHIHSVRYSQFLFQALRTRPQGYQGCQKIKNFMPNKILAVWSADIQTKLRKRKKTAKVYLKLHCFWPDFVGVLSFSWILAVQINKFVFCTKFLYFWHPMHP